MDVCDEVKVIKPLECVPPGKEWKDISDEILFDLFVHLPGDGNLCPINSLSPTSSRKISKSSKHSPPAALRMMKLSTIVGSSNPRSRSLTLTLRFTLSATPSLRLASTNSGIPARAVHVSFTGSGSISNPTPVPNLQDFRGRNHEAAFNGSAFEFGHGCRRVTATSPPRFRSQDLKGQ